jgi:hypothetical protein
VWFADVFYNFGYPNDIGPDGVIANTDTPTIYQSHRWGAPDDPDLQYTIPVATGRYRLVFHFCETFFENVGERVFSVKVQGNTVQSLVNVDLIARAGFMAAYKVTVPSVIVGPLAIVTITMLSVQESPLLSAIEIYPDL